VDLLSGGGFLGGCGPSAAGDDDDSLPRSFVGCVLSSVLSSMAELRARTPPDVPPPEGVADMPVVRELIVRTLARLAVTDSKRFLDVTNPDFDPYRGSLKALGRLACVSRGYRNDTRDPYVVNELLEGLAEPGWREWARGWRGKTAARRKKENDNATSDANPTPRVDLHDVHRLLRAEHVAKHVIDASNSELFASRRARGEDTTARDEWRPSTLRFSVAFPPARNELQERDDAALEARRARRDELEREYAPHRCAGECLDRRARRLVDALEANSDCLREEYESRADKASATFAAASSAASNGSYLSGADFHFRRRVASYALAHRTCARLRACLADPVFQFKSLTTPRRRTFADMVFFVETQRTDARDATIRDVIARGGDVVVGAYDPARVTHFIVADGCFDPARAMTPPWTRFGPDAALAALRDGDRDGRSWSPLQPHVELAMRDGKGVVPWSWIRACVEAPGGMPVGSPTVLEPMPRSAFPSSPSETECSREEARWRFEEAWRDMHRIADVARLRRLLRERKRLKRKLKRVQTARDKHNSDSVVVKAREDFKLALARLSQLESDARCKGPQLACRDPNPDEGAVFPPSDCLVRFYPDSLDSPPWPGANLDRSAEAAHQRTTLRRFQKMKHTRFNPVTYRSAAVAPARDVLTMRPFIEGDELMPPEWAEWAELDFPQDHPLSELYDENNDLEAECEYVGNIRDAFPCPPVDVPVMLGYPIISEEAVNFWTEVVGFPDTPVGDMSEKDACLLLLQIAPHGPQGSWIAFLATEETLRNRKWTLIHHRIYPANFEG